MSLAIRQTVSSTHETIYWPSDQPRGGIICLHGSEGGWSGWNDLTCALFAANGFAALSRNYTQNAQWLIHPDIDNVPLEGTHQALAAMRAEMASYGCGTGIFGVSRGAEQALLLAQILTEDGSSDTPDAVLVHSPPDAVWPAFIVANFLHAEQSEFDALRPAWSWRGSHERTKPGTPLCSAAVPYPIFIAQGTEDTIWDAEMARRLQTRLEQNGCSSEAHFFEGEGHIFRTSARNHEWALMLDFLDRHLTHDA